MKQLLKDCYNYIRLRFFNRSHLISTKLSKGNWYDKDIMILHGIMELLVDFVDKEKCFEMWETENSVDKYVKNEIIEIYNWWKVYKNVTISLHLDEENYKTENEMLIRLIKIRDYLWT